MEEILWFMHDSVAATDEEKAVLADTTLYLYDKAIEYEPEKKGTYLTRRAYVLEIWKKAPVEEVIEAYETAFTEEDDIDTFYKDRLGIIFMQNDDGANNYKLKALDVYSDLSEKEPDNPLWIQRIESLAESPEELVEISKKAWDLDKDNPEKAWKYASNCIRAKMYDRAVEPLEFLIEQSPEVINYWKQLATSYEKLESNDQAINAYKKLIELQPDNRDNYVNLAIIYKKINQLSVARSYLQKATKVSSDWDYPYIIEAQLYEQAARECIAGEFEFIDKCIYQLAVNTYKKARSLGGSYAQMAGERINALANSVPSTEDYFFRKIEVGDEIKIEGKCYDWIGRSITRDK
jgi:tetratricopeptide (TPR) repeat protein